MSWVALREEIEAEFAGLKNGLDWVERDHFCSGLVVFKQDAARRSEAREIAELGKDQPRYPMYIPTPGPNRSLQGLSTIEYRRDLWERQRRVIEVRRSIDPIASLPDPLQQPWFCPVCDETFGTMHAMRAHAWMVHKVRYGKREAEGVGSDLGQAAE